MKSTHKAEVVEIKLEKHPNADTLSVITVFGGYTCCVRTDEWKNETLGVYIPPDSIVDSQRPEFSFLIGHERIKVKKLRGVISMGLMIHVPNGDFKVGDDLAPYFGITHYEPPLAQGSHGEDTISPKGYHPCYDLDSLRRWSHVLLDNEPLWITEKIHGANARYCFTEGKMHAGSRTAWKREEQTNLWWRALNAHPEVSLFCKENPDITVYGEVYGQVQDLKYGAKPGEVKIAVFDLLRRSEWVGAEEARQIAPDLPWVPLIANAVPFQLDRILAIAEGKSLIADHLREGIVVKPLIERTHPEIGRVCLKVVSNGYLERA